MLLVEDDSLIRLSTADLLKDLGHLVVEAGNATDALAVLLTDLGLPGTSGNELALQARRSYPQLRIIFASGKDVVPGMKERPELAAAIILRKPYDRNGLTEALKSSVV